MRPEVSLRNDTTYLHHICDEVRFLQTISKDLTYEGLLQDPVLQRAVIRSLEVMGGSFPESINGLEVSVSGDSVVKNNRYPKSSDSWIF